MHIWLFNQTIQRKNSRREDGCSRIDEMLILKDCIWKSTAVLERGIFGDVACCYGMKVMDQFIEVHGYGRNLTSNVSK